MTTIRERRHRDLIAQLARTSEQRETTIAKLVKLDGKLKMLQRQVRRYEKLCVTSELSGVLKLRGETESQTVETQTVAPHQKPVQEVADKPPAPAPAPATAGGDQLEVPDFLRRTKEGDMRDKLAADALRAEQDARKKTKARNRIDDMKAKQRGDTKRMPVSGKAAMALINAG